MKFTNMQTYSTEAKLQFSAFIQNTHSSVQATVADFLNQNRLSYFTYGLYNQLSNQFCILTTHADFYHKRINLNFPLVGQIFSNGLYLWTESLPTYLLEMAEAHYFKNPLNIIQSTQNHIEVITFGAALNHNNSNGFYMNNVEQLKQFVKYFKDNNERLITHAKQNMVACPLSMHDIKHGSQTNEILQAEFYETPRLYLSSTNEYISLTAREKQVLKHYLQGSTAKNIAQKIFLSARTIESYIERIKVKLNIRTKEELFDLAILEGWVRYHIVV